MKRIHPAYERKAYVQRMRHEPLKSVPERYIERDHSKEFHRKERVIQREIYAAIDDASINLALLVKMADDQDRRFVERLTKVVDREHEKIREYGLPKEDFMSMIVTHLGTMKHKYERLSAEKPRDKNYSSWQENIQAIEGLVRNADTANL